MMEPLRSAVLSLQTLGFGFTVTLVPHGEEFPAVL